MIFRPVTNFLRPSQKGQALVIFALAATFLVGIAGLAIEGGMLEADRRFDQDISDGAALAGSHKLPTDASGALTQAAHYAVTALNGGSIPTGCDPSGLAVNNSLTTLPALCDPSPTHSLLIQTPYNGHSDQILVRLNHGRALNLAAVVGAGSASTASRSVAKSFTGGNPFNYAVYAGGNMTTIGNTDTTVFGNVYVRGCVEYNNSDNLFVSPSSGGTQKGTVEIYIDPTVPGVGSAPQVWNSGAGNGCTATIQGAAGPNQQWGASGHLGGSSQTCATTQFNPGTCPTSPAEPPVPLVGFPTFNIQDTTGGGGQACDLTTPGTFTTSGNPPIASSGCFTACGDVSIPAGTVFSPGTYAFVGKTNCSNNVIFTGTASNSTSGGDGSGGVTFILYNGASMCASSCGSSSSSGTLTFNAPTLTTDRNFGMLVYSCNGTCGNSSGEFHIEGPHWDVNLIGTIYNPGGFCVIKSNANQHLTGQLICHNVDLQGGAVASGSGVSWNSNAVGTPVFQSQLIE